jgi:hypothetical protein
MVIVAGHIEHGDPSVLDAQQTVAAALAHGRAVGEGDL